MPSCLAPRLKAALRVAWRNVAMIALSRILLRRDPAPPVMGVDAPPPRPTIGAALLVALVFSGLWLAAVTLASLVTGHGWL